MSVLRESPWYSEILKEGRGLGLQEGRNLGLEEGRNLGLQIGEQQGMARLINQMVQKGVSDEQIEQLTGLAIDELQSMCADDAGPETLESLGDEDNGVDSA